VTPCSMSRVQRIIMRQVPSEAYDELDPG